MHSLDKRSPTVVASEAALRSGKSSLGSQVTSRAGVRKLLATYHVTVIIRFRRPCALSYASLDSQVRSTLEKINKRERRDKSLEFLGLRMPLERPSTTTAREQSVLRQARTLTEASYRPFPHRLAPFPFRFGNVVALRLTLTGGCA